MANGMLPEERDRLARAEEQIRGLREDLCEVKTDVKRILAVLNQLDGGKRVLWGMYLICGTLLTLLVGVLTKIIPSFR